jgi:hypothetical protein
MNAIFTARYHRSLPAQPSFLGAAMRPLAAGLASLALSACLHFITPAPPGPEAVDLNCKLPTLAPLAGTKEVQEKGGIVPPRTDQEVTIYGPPIAGLLDHQTIGLL